MFNKAASASWLLINEAKICKYDKEWGLLVSQKIERLVKQKAAIAIAKADESK